ncbi:MAG: hypothetical protein ACW99U_16600 [Candidatus Thorarchaeota archaeon]|jgi:hypothetical protein
MALTNSEVRKIRDTLQEKLSGVGKEMGMDLRVGNARYDDNSVTFQLVASVVTADGEVLTPEVEAFRRNARAFGFQPDDLYAEVHTSRGLGKIVGLKPRNRKYPVIVERNGKRFKMSTGQVLAQLKNQNS